MKNIAVLLTLVALLALLGCQDEKQYVYGKRTRDMFASQVLNPEAGGNQPVEGMDGPKALKSMKDYEEGAVKSGQMKDSGSGQGAGR